MARPATLIIPGLLLEVAGIVAIAARQFLPLQPGMTLSLGVGLIAVGAVLQVAGLIRAARNRTPADA